MSKKGKDKISHASVVLEFNNFKPIENTGFVRGECRVAYAGKNRNYSNISKEAFEVAEPTIFGTPIVGNWIEDSSEDAGGRFGGHDIILETRGNEIVMKDSTVPFGFVPQDANPRWIAIEDENGNSKNYYTVDVILWRERYPSQIDSIIDKKANHSMEIMIEDGEWDENWEYFNINNFYYSALCLLGRDDVDNSKDVEPCFEDSEITVDSFSFDEDFSIKISELKEAFKGGEVIAMSKEEDKVEINEEKFNSKGDVEEKNKKDINEEGIDYELEFKTISKKFNDLIEDYNALDSNNADLIMKLEDLKKYKLDKENEILEGKKDSLISDYSLILDEDEIENVVNKKSEISYSDLEVQLSKLVAEKNLKDAKRKKASSQKEDLVFSNEIFDKNKDKNKFAI